MESVCRNGYRCLGTTLETRVMAFDFRLVEARLARNFVLANQSDADIRGWLMERLEKLAVAKIGGG